jgi:ligand-binding sensor domain-containing protein/signal transduction histidine kinase
MDYTLSWKVYILFVALFAGLAFVCARASVFATDLVEPANSMHTWHVADGVPSDYVTAVVQGRDGFIWVGTSAGLARFDGVKFTKVNPPESLTNNLTGITALCEDSNGYLWIGTEQNGLFELAQGRMLHYGREQGFSNDNVTSLAADGHGQVWIGSDAGLSRWTGRKFDIFTRADGLPDEFIAGVNVARSGTVWITTHEGMCQFVGGHIAPYAFQTESQGRSPEYLGAYEDRRGNLWAFGDTYLINLAEGKRFNYFRSSESPSVRIWSLCEGADGRLWIGTSGRGLFCFEDNRFQPVMPSENRWPYDVRAIFEDREGNLWLGTSGGGLTYMRLQSIHVWPGGQGLPDNPPTSLALDADGRIYVGLQRGGVWMRESGRYEQLGGSEGSELQSFISSICVARDGTTWAGTLGDGLYGLRNRRSIRFTTADGLADDTVLAVCVDLEGNVWASTLAGGVHRLSANRLTRFGSAQGLPEAAVTVMISAAGGGLWLGTRDGQIMREQDGKFTVFEVQGSSGHYPVLALHEAEQKRLWIGTLGGGLLCCTNGATMSWNVNDGLPNENIAGIVEDSAKNLWLATGAGICRIAHGDVLKALEGGRIPLSCKLVSPAKAMPESETVFGGPRAALSPDGYICFATSEGMLNVDTHQSKIETSVFPVYIESAAMNGEKPVLLLHGGLWPSLAATNRPFKASVDLRSLEIHFTALSFAAPEEIQFRHKLEGFDSDWVDDAGTRFARYGRLPHGDYGFLVAARSAGGAWQEATEAFAFTVPTHIYYQTWAICLYAITAVGLVAGIVRVISHRRLRNTLLLLEQQQSLERERMRIARDMHDEIGSKLTKISFLSEHVQMEATANQPLNEKIQSIAHTSRELLKTMDEIVWVVNPRNDTLENLTAYLSHYAVEYFQNTSIECELQLPPDIPQLPVSSETRHNLFLTFEESLNNVLKHSAATNVKVAMAVTALVFELKITDNGKGFDMPAENRPAHGARAGNGLKNMRQRLSAIGGQCAVSSHPGAGACVTIRLRLTRKPVADR